MKIQGREFDLSNEINQLSDDELDVVSGGETLSLNFSRVQMSYHSQNADGSPKDS